MKVKNIKSIILLIVLSIHVYVLKTHGDTKTAPCCCACCGDGNNSSSGTSSQGKAPQGGGIHPNNKNNIHTNLKNNNNVNNNLEKNSNSNANENNIDESNNNNDSINNEKNNDDINDSNNNSLKNSEISENNTDKEEINNENNTDNNQENDENENNIISNTDKNNNNKYNSNILEEKNSKESSKIPNNIINNNNNNNNINNDKISTNTNINNLNENIDPSLNNNKPVDVDVKLKNNLVNIDYKYTGKNGTFLDYIKKTIKIDPQVGNVFVYKIVGGFNFKHKKAYKDYKDAEIKNEGKYYLVLNARKMNKIMTIYFNIVELKGEKYIDSIGGGKAINQCNLGVKNINIFPGSAISELKCTIENVNIYNTFLNNPNNKEKITSTPRKSTTTHKVTPKHTDTPVKLCKLINKESNIIKKPIYNKNKKTIHSHINKTIDKTKTKPIQPKITNNINNNRVNNENTTQNKNGEKNIKIGNISNKTNFKNKINVTSNVKKPEGKGGNINKNDVKKKTNFNKINNNNKFNVEPKPKITLTKKLNIIEKNTGSTTNPYKQNNVTNKNVTKEAYKNKNNTFGQLNNNIQKKIKSLKMERGKEKGNGKQGKNNIKKNK